MKKTFKKENFYSIVCICLIIDQLIKMLVRSKLTIHEEVSIIPHFFSLYNTANTGAAFSLFSGKAFFLILISFLALIIIYTFIQQEKNLSKLSLIALSIVYGGILGNLIDRLLYRAVTDYFLFYIGNYAFPVFNLADIFITGGIFLYLFSELQIYLKTKKIAKIKKS